MKSILQKLVLSFLVMAGLSFLNKTSAQQNDYNSGYDNNSYNYNNDRDVSYQNFYDELSPYGRWVEYPGQGSRTDGTSYVWVPDAEQDFQPYSTNGHWVWTEDYEWMWASDYDWGWAPFHYGRWDRDDYYGWYWVPGYEWSPAWVAWRDGGDYYGWAPLRPGISINVSIGNYNPPSNFWCFTPRRYITHQRWYDYRVDYRQNVSIINYTTIINYNTYNNNNSFRSGPRRYDAERYCGRINPVRFRESNSPGRTSFRNNEVSMYRPRVNQNDNGRHAPQQFERYDRNNGFRNGGRSDNGNRTDNGNRQPDGRDRVNNERGGIRNNNDNRVRDNQRSNDNNNRGFDRQRQNDNNPGNRSGEGRVIRPDDRRERQANPSTGNNDNRRFERPNNGNGNNMPDRRVQPQRQPTQQPTQQPDRRFEQGQRPQQQTERRVEPQRQPAQQPQQQPARQFERRSDGNNGGGGGQRNSGSNQPQRPQQAERRNEQPQQQPQQQPSRQIERRSDGSNGNSGGNGGGQSSRGENRGRGRF